MSNFAVDHHVYLHHPDPDLAARVAALEALMATLREELEGLKSDIAAEHEEIRSLVADLHAKLDALEAAGAADVATVQGLRADVTRISDAVAQAPVPTEEPPTDGGEPA